jgi:phosphoribosylformylglycinamidine cyclo-ligase
MFRTFNMGIGLIVVVAAADADRLLDEVHARGGAGAKVIGEIVPGGEPLVEIKHRV